MNSLVRKAPFLILLVLFPFVTGKYHVSLLTEVVIFALFGVSYNLLLGYGNLLSFGHAMFFGLGAYTTAVVLHHIPGLGFFPAILLGTGCATLGGLLVGFLILRQKGASFALLTLAFNALFYAMATKFTFITHGDDGLSVIRPKIDFGIFTLNTSDVVVFYFVTLAIVGAVILLSWYFTGTAMGKTITLMCENEERMKFLGYSTNTTRLTLFTLTGGLAGLAGSFYALFFCFVSVDAISIAMTTTVLLITFVGGIGSFAGPILGAFVYIYLQNFLSDVTDRWQLFMGLIFIAMVLFVPGGISKLLQDMPAWWRAGHQINADKTGE
ncbi:MAG: branched-chain amino acid ABC transporter permease [Deltaproteobacteria bacterium]|nr:branched-chain amino acid ABC transporter permease [Deltaproteobacteria bacterium]